MNRMGRSLFYERLKQPAVPLCHPRYLWYFVMPLRNQTFIGGFCPSNRQVGNTVFDFELRVIVKGLTIRLNRLKKLHFVNFGLSFANPCVSDRN